MSHQNIVRAEDCILVVIDMQDTFLRVIHQAEKITTNTIKLIKAASIFSAPVINTVQYPMKLGSTSPSVLAELPSGLPQIAKTSFSCMDGGVFEEQLANSGRKQVLVCGVETHVCVTQTALDLLDAGYSVHIIADAVSSRGIEDHRIGIAKMQQAGCIISCTEMAIYEMTKDASRKEFKQIHQLVK